MKKLFAILLAAAMLLSLAGCGEKTTPTQPDQTDKAANASVSVTSDGKPWFASD